MAKKLKTSQIILRHKYSMSVFVQVTSPSIFEVPFISLPWV